jgi:hypothetical protein
MAIRAKLGHERVEAVLADEPPRDPEDDFSSP